MEPIIRIFQRTPFQAALKRFSSALEFASKYLARRGAQPIVFTPNKNYARSGLFSFDTFDKLHIIWNVCAKMLRIKDNMKVLSGVKSGGRGNN